MSERDGRLELGSSALEQKLLASFYEYPVSLLGVDADNGRFKLGNPDKIYPCLIDRSRE
jgi:hypothetical protein